MPSIPRNSIAHIMTGTRGRPGHSRGSGMLALERRPSECSVGKEFESSRRAVSIIDETEFKAVSTVSNVRIESAAERLKRAE